jgi:hypothetical protein
VLYPEFPSGICLLRVWTGHGGIAAANRVEIQHWSYDFEKPRQPVRLIFVRGSGGGMGVYERDLQVFALRGFQLRKLFSGREDRRECAWPKGNCDFQHAGTTIEEENGEPRALEVRESRLSVDPKDNQVLDHGWWHGLPRVYLYGIRLESESVIVCQRRRSHR